MNMKSKLVAALIAAGVVAAPAAQAFNLGYAGPVKFEFGNLDAGTTGYLGPNPDGTGVACTTVATCDTAAASPAPGGIGSEDTWAIFSISRIVADNPSATTLWTAGDGGEYLTGIVYGLMDTNVNLFTDPDSGDLTVRSYSTGGGVKVFISNSNTYDGSGGPAARTGSTSYPGSTDGSLFLDLAFDLGANGTTLGQGATYTSRFTADEVAGIGQGFLSVIGGSAADSFNTNGLTNFTGAKSDIFLTTTFDNVTGISSWTASSVSQAKGNVIPEPGSLVLVGLGLAGAALASKRRKV